MNLNFKQQSVGETTYLMFDLDDNLMIDHFAMNMMARNHIANIVKTQIVQINESRQVQFDVTGLMKLSSKITRPLPKKEVISILNSILNAFEETDAYMMDMEHLLLVCEHVYLDGQNNCMLLYLPFDHIYGKDKISFLQETVSRIQPDFQEKDPYLFDILNAFSRGAVRKLSDFREIIKKNSSISVGRYVEDKKENLAEMQKKEENAVHMEPVLFLPQEKKENPASKTAEKRSGGRIPVINIPGYETGVKAVPTESFQTAEKKQREKKKKEKNSFFKKNDVKRGMNENEVPDMKNCGTVENVKMISPDIKNKQNNMYESYEHTVIIQESSGRQECGRETIMLEETETSAQIFASLVRKQDGYIYQIGKGDTIVGSGSGANIRIANNGAISRNHAKIVYVNNNYFLEDNQSKNGSFVNGRRLYPGVREPLYDGMLLRFANEDFEFREMKW